MAILALLTNPRVLLILFAICALILWVTIESGIPLTDHARNSHTGQLWDAQKIYDYMLGDGKCTPPDINMYACPDEDFEVYCVEIHPGKAIGILVGATVRQIISGLMARTSWWLDRCK